MKNEKNSKPKATTKRKSVAQAIAKQDQETQEVLKHSPEIQEAIRLKAYELYLERGSLDGHHLQDWAAAEKIILQRIS